MVSIHIWKARAKIRKAHFDIFRTGWAFQDPKTTEGHSAIVEVTATRETFGVSMQRAAASLYARLIPYPISN